MQNSTNSEAQIHEGEVVFDTPHKPFGNDPFSYWSQKQAVPPASNPADLDLSLMWWHIIVGVIATEAVRYVFGRGTKNFFDS